MKAESCRLILLLLIAISWTPLFPAPDFSPEKPLTFSFYHRFRVESWDNAINLDRETEDGFNYTRHKSSFSLAWKARENLEFSAKLSNEFRVYLAPKGRRHNNEIFVDNLYMKWTQKELIPFTLTVGRQDIHLGEGFVVMDGQAATGSRSFYFNALRLDLIPWENHTFTLFYGFVPRTDNLLPVIKLIDADDQLLNEQASTSMGAYYSGVFPFAILETYLIRKDTRQNEWFPREHHFLTLGARIVGRFSDRLTLTGEAAMQSGKLRDTSAADQPDTDMTALGAQAHLDYLFPEDLIFFRSLRLGGIFLSGDDPSTADRTEAWDPVYSRWPKWSESYIYTLIPEQGVAYWSNLSSLYLTLNGSITSSLSCKLSYQVLGAQNIPGLFSFPGGSGKNRGQLFTAQLLMVFTKQLSRHVLWEHFLPGSYYFDEASSYSWLRFELLFKL